MKSLGISTIHPEGDMNSCQDISLVTTNQPHVCASGEVRGSPKDTLDMVKDTMNVFTNVCANSWVDVEIFQCMSENLDLA